MNSNPQTFADITPDMIRDWKAKYGNIRQIDIDNEEGEIARFIVRSPGRNVMDAIGAYGLKKEYASASKVLISNCVLAGDIDMMEADGGVYTALLEELNKLTNKKKATVKKL